MENLRYDFFSDLAGKLLNEKDFSASVIAFTTNPKGYISLYFETGDNYNRPYYAKKFNQIFSDLSGQIEKPHHRST